MGHDTPYRRYRSTVMRNSTARMFYCPLRPRPPNHVRPEWAVGHARLPGSAARPPGRVNIERLEGVADECADIPTSHLHINLCRQGSGAEIAHEQVMNAPCLAGCYQRPGPGASQGRGASRLVLTLYSRAG